MTLTELKQELLLPEREIILSRTVCAQGYTGVLACITQQSDTIKLWTIYERELPDWVYENYDEDTDPEFASNREEYTLRAKADFSSLWISALTIQGQQLHFDTGSAGPLMPEQYTQMMQLQHFLDAGVDLSLFDHSRMRYITIAEYTAQEGSVFPIIDPAKPLDISITIGSDSREHLIGHTHTAELKKEDPTRYTFTDAKGKEHAYYICGLELQDAWKDAEQLYDSEENQQKFGLSHAEAMQAKQHLLTHLSGLCSKGNMIAAITYESEQDEQLVFYTKEKLDAAPVYSNSAASIGISGDYHIGPHGHTLRYAYLCEVPPHFSQPIEIELFSYYEMIPEQTICLEEPPKKI